MSAIGVIGGTGVYDPSIFENIHEESLMTPYGEIDYVQGTYKGKTVIFVARHGKDHTIPPHKINFLILQKIALLHSMKVANVR